MKKLLTVCQWGKNRRKAWSGTYLSVYNELQKHYDVTDEEIKISFFKNLRRYLAYKTSVVRHDFLYSVIRKNGPRLSKKYKDSRLCSFQYDEYDLGENVHSYIYQDMCMQYQFEVLYQKPELKEFWPYKRYITRCVQKRIRNQAEFYKKCSGIFTMGAWLADYLVEELKVDPAKVHVVGAGIDINPEAMVPVERTKTKILFVGRDFKRKAGYLVVEAFQKLRSQYMPDAELYIIGPDENPLGTTPDGVHFMGSMNKEELIQYYAKCDIFCMPSYLEPFGKVFVEALCCGLPCIARNSFAMKDIIEDGVNGYLIDEDDADKLAMKMHMLLTDEKIKAYVEEKSGYYRKEYSWEAVVSRMTEVIDRDEYMQ